jgi:hypothetical protein
MITMCIVDNNHDCEKAIINHYSFMPKDSIIKYVNDVNIKSTSDYSALLMTKAFWESFDTEDILIFQHDSALLRTGIEEFLGYDYIGATWWFEPYVGNGGLSLRKKSAMLHILDNYNLHKEMPEDVYFAYGCRDLGLKLAPIEAADKFSVESKFVLGSMGYHQIERYFTKEQCEIIKNQYKILNK